jgi:hypothetical protein
MSFGLTQGLWQNESVHYIPAEKKSIDRQPPKNFSGQLPHFLIAYFIRLPRLPCCK